MEPLNHIAIPNLDQKLFSQCLQDFIKTRFKQSFSVSEKDSTVFINYKNETYQLELPIFISKNKLSFYSHYWKLDSGNISGFGSYLQHLIQAWIYKEYNIPLPTNSDFIYSHSKFENYSSWLKHIVKNRSFMYKLNIKLYSSVPKILFKL
jgi:hypothetical protein